jgi:hypothetical protein
MPVIRLSRRAPRTLARAEQDGKRLFLWLRNGPSRLVYEALVRYIHAQERAEAEEAK